MTILKEEHRVINTESLGKCPKCGSNNLEYADKETFDETVGWHFKCNDCGVEGMEWYAIEYAESEYYTEEGDNQ